MDLKEIGAKIRAKRKSLGLSQGELAEDVGYSGKDMISKIEAGKVNMAMDKVVAIADRLGLRPSDLLCEPIAKDYRETVNDVDYLIEGLDGEDLSKLKQYADLLRSAKQWQQQNGTEKDGGSGSGGMAR